eukprot:SAG31_NODE_31508_length_367_cov_0.955224_1_plen_25_part_01
MTDYETAVPDVNKAQMYYQVPIDYY